MTGSTREPKQAGPFGLAVPPPESDSRTLFKRCMLEGVLPVVTLVSMSVLTIAMIVAIVTTVAQAGWLDPGTYVEVDPWSGVGSDADALHAATAQWPDATSGPQAHAGHFAAGAPE